MLATCLPVLIIDGNAPVASDLGLPGDAIQAAAADAEPDRDAIALSLAAWWRKRRPNRACHARRCTGAWSGAASAVAR